MDVDDSLIESGYQYQKASAGRYFALFAVIIFSTASVICAGIVATQLFKVPRQISALDNEYLNAKVSGQIERVDELPATLGSNDVVCGGAGAPYIRVPADGTNYYLNNGGTRQFKGYRTDTLHYLSTPCSGNYEYSKAQLHQDNSKATPLSIAAITYVLSLISLYLLTRPKKAKQPPFGSKLELYVAKTKPELSKPELKNAVVQAEGLILDGRQTIRWQDIREFGFTTLFSSTAVMLKLKDGSECLLSGRNFEDLQKIYKKRMVSMAAPGDISKAVASYAAIKDIKNDKTMSALVNALRFNKIKGSIDVTSRSDFMLYSIVGYAALLAPFVVFGQVYGANSSHPVLQVPIILVPFFALVISSIVYAQKRDKLSFAMAKLLEV